ncbi:MAG: 50S ribosomal protein L19 [Parachlamydiaceae bacterium]
MSKDKSIQKLEESQLKSEICQFRVGDTIRVHTRIIEGEKERIQVFAGTVIARKGSGLSETFSVHRVAYGEGMERVFLLHSPRIAKIELVQEGAVRRSKLYYLRGTSGKASKVKPRFRNRKTVDKANSQAYASEEKVGAEPVEITTES